MNFTLLSVKSMNKRIYKLIHLKQDLSGRGLTPNLTVCLRNPGEDTYSMPHSGKTFH